MLRPILDRIRTGVFLDVNKWRGLVDLQPRQSLQLCEPCKLHVVHRERGGT
jgi:hypothetical protein